jgi:nicotinamide mononucleotide (NMN) deamidase PncC
MAEKIRLITRTDYALSTTGNLGPDLLEGKERGLVYVGISKEGKTIIKELRLKGERARNKEEAAISALSLLRDELSG